MNTFGVSPQLGGEVDAAGSPRAHRLSRGYLFDRPEAKAASGRPRRSPGADGRWRSPRMLASTGTAEFLALIRLPTSCSPTRRDHLLYQTKCSTGARHAGRHQALAAPTRHRRGSVIPSEGKSTAIARRAGRQRAADTTGAAMLYAAGFLFGIATSKGSSRPPAARSLAGLRSFPTGARPEIKPGIRQRSRGCSAVGASARPSPSLYHCGCAPDTVVRPHVQPRGLPGPNLCMVGAVGLSTASTGCACWPRVKSAAAPRFRSCGWGPCAG
jgi:hypothetical protein